MKKKGLFITFEGPEGCGKTTQIKLLAAYLEEKGLKVLRTREPGGTPIGEKIREILLNPDFKEMYPATESYLYASSRAQIVREVIKPAVDEGTTVLCDRFIDSSLVYQGAGRDLGIEKVFAINRPAVERCMPDITFVLMVHPSIGLRRAKAESNKEGFAKGDRLEQEHMKFHLKIYEGFKKLGEFRDNIHLINGERPIEDVFSEIGTILKEKYGI